MSTSTTISYYKDKEMNMNINHILMDLREMNMNINHNLKDSKEMIMN